MYLNVAIYQDAAEYISLSRFAEGGTFNLLAIASLATAFGTLAACQDDSSTFPLSLPSPRPTPLRIMEI